MAKFVVNEQFEKHALNQPTETLPLLLITLSHHTSKLASVYLPPQAVTVTISHHACPYCLLEAMIKCHDGKHQHSFHPYLMSERLPPITHNRGKL